MTSPTRVNFPSFYQPYFRPCRFKGLKGGRGSGKSHAFAGHGVLLMAQKKIRFLGVREVQKSIKTSSKQLMADKIEAYGLGHIFDVQDITIKCKLTGSVADFTGMQNHTSDSVKSFEGADVAWIEEAQSLSQKSLDMLTPTIRKPGSEIWASWNPGDQTDPIDAFFLQHETDPDFLLKHVNFDQNPWFPDELRRDMERMREREPDKYAHVWEGMYRTLSEARVFRNWRIGELDPPDNVIWFYGLDFGFAVDPCAALRVCFPAPGVAYIDHEAYEHGVATDKMPEFVSRVPSSDKWPVQGDGARPETIDYLRRHGYPKIRSAKKGKGSVEDGITFLQGFDIVVHPRCEHTIDELRRYAYKIDPRTEEILPVIEDAHNHCIDALRYATRGLHRKDVMQKAVVEEKPVQTAPTDAYRAPVAETVVAI